MVYMLFVLLRTSYQMNKINKIYEWTYKDFMVCKHKTENFPFQKTQILYLPNCVNKVQFQQISELEI